MSVITKGNRYEFISVAINLFVNQRKGSETMVRISHHGTRKMQYAFFLGLILIFCISLVYAGLLSKGASAHTFSQTVEAEMLSVGISPHSCRALPAREPDPDSLLIVLLDRSGSLIDEPGATDPNH